MTEKALKHDTGKIDLTLIPWRQVGDPYKVILILPLYDWYRGNISANEVVKQMRAIWTMHGRCLITDMAGAFNFGAKKYAAWNWEKGISRQRLYAAACRHYLAIERGETEYLERLGDEDHLQNHWWNLAWYAAAIYAALDD